MFEAKKLVQVLLTQFCPDLIVSYIFQNWASQYRIIQYIITTINAANICHGFIVVNVGTISVIIGNDYHPSC